jgi:hypothetical protein
LLYPKAEGDPRTIEQNAAGLNRAGGVNLPHRQARMPPTSAAVAARV